MQLFRRSSNYTRRKPGVNPVKQGGGLLSNLPKAFTTFASRSTLMTAMRSIPSSGELPTQKSGQGGFGSFIRPRPVGPAKPIGIMGGGLPIARPVGPASGGSGSVGPIAGPIAVGHPSVPGGTGHVTSMGIIARPVGPARPIERTY